MWEAMICESSGSFGVFGWIYAFVCFGSMLAAEARERRVTMELELGALGSDEGGKLGSERKGRWAEGRELGVLRADRLAICSSFCQACLW